MLDIIFYETETMQPKYIEVSEELYEWLARSNFSKIGRSIKQSIKIDDETEILPLVELDPKNRSLFRLFFLEAIAEESDRLLTQLTEHFEKEDYRKISDRLRKLQELRKCVENFTHQYLQRI